MDAISKNILALLQADASLSVSDIAERVNLSSTACWKRIQRLTRDGTISRQVCLLDRKKLGVDITVFVAIKTNKHELQWLEKFAANVRDIPEVVEFYRMSGDVDYLLKIVAPDIAGFDKIYKKLIRSAELFDVSSSFAMEEIKHTTALPLDYC